MTDVTRPAGYLLLAEAAMAELEAITEMLRRQRRDLDELGEDTLSRSSETSALLAKLEELRVRSEHTRRLFERSDRRTDNE